MNAIFNTLLRATTGWGRIGTALGPNVTAQAYKTGKYAR